MEIHGSSLRFAFRGKSGREWRLKLSDRRIVKIVRAVQELPGQNLFQYVDEDGSRHEINSQNVNDYIREAIGPTFTSKHFRTWNATVFAALELSTNLLPETKRAQMLAWNQVVDRVAAKLNNTRTVCRNCYSHPGVLDEWMEGVLCDRIKEIRARARRPFKNLDADESTVLRWLERHTS